MKVSSVALLLLIAASQIFSAPPATAARRQIRVTSANRAHFQVISDLNALHLTGACYFSNNGGAHLGSISRGVFRTPVVAHGAARSVVSSAARRCALRAQARGASRRRLNPTPTPATNPTSAPTKVPTTAPTPRPTSGTSVPAGPVPQLALWESHMISFGRTHCANLKGNTLTADQKLAAVYYDAEWVFYQIGDYTKDTSWYDCAQAAEAVYRDQYVVPNSGVVPGYWNFSHGLMQDYLRTGDLASKNAVNLLATRAAFAVDTTPLSSTADNLLSREVAYAIMVYLNQETVGYPHRARTEALVSQALGHLDQWFVAQTAPYVRPFMFSLTAHALISYDEQIGGDSRILPALENGANWIWDHTWLPANQAFMYTDRSTDSGGMEPAPDLNLLIAPVYAWLWYQTGNTVYRDRADQIFAGGVTQAFLSQGKQFDQSYRLSFLYLKWRNSQPLR